MKIWQQDWQDLPRYSSVTARTETVQGCLEVSEKHLESYLCEIAGMERMTFQPAAGAHGEFTGLLLIKAYHKSRGDEKT